jgi:hypothetical protein
MESEFEDGSECVYHPGFDYVSHCEAECVTMRRACGEGELGAEFLVLSLHHPNPEHDQAYVQESVFRCESEKEEK